MNIKYLILYFLITFLLLSCGGKGTVTEVSSYRSSSGLSISITAVEISDNQLLLSGSGFDVVTNVQITGPNSFNETFNIEDQTNNSLIVNGTKALSFTIGSVFNLILSNAYGAATFSIGFTLQDGSVTAAKLSDMGANDGDVLVWDDINLTWSPDSINGLNYQGLWDASSGFEPVNPGVGNYYFVSVSGTTPVNGIVDWDQGDWVIHNGSSWQKIDNSTLIPSVFGRTGAILAQINDYTWEQIDKSNSTLGGIADVSISSTPAADEVLAWNDVTLKWEPANVTIGVASISSVELDTDSVDSSKVMDNSLTNADISASAAIIYSKLSISDGDLTIAKVSGLETTLGAKLSISGGTMTGDVNMNNNNINTVGTIDGVDISSLNASVTTNSISLSTLDTSDVSENTTSGGLYFTDLRAKAAVVNDSITDTIIDIAPSQNAVFDALELKQDNVTSTSDIFVNSITTATRAGIVINPYGNSASQTGEIHFQELASSGANYVGFRASDTLGVSTTWTLPISDGVSGNVLSTNGNGVLSWTSATLADGQVTAAKLHDMGASDGDVLKWDDGSSTWVTENLNGLNYKGTWNASSDDPDIGGLTPGAGDYYYVSASGAGDLPGISSWGESDWAIYNGSEWQKIDNSTITITSVFGRVGPISAQTNDYTWAQINKSTSSITDISDVDTAGVSSGKILKWDGSKWTISDDVNSGGAESVSSTEIVDGAIVDADISASAAIAMAKIDGLEASLGAKQDIITNPVTGTGTDNRVTLWSGTNSVDASSITETKLNYLNDVTSDIQAQIDSKLDTTDEDWDATTGGIYYNSGIVGVGTASPEGPLHIGGGNDVSGIDNVGEGQIVLGSGTWRLRIDENELQSSQNGDARAFTINKFGGDIQLGDSYLYVDASPDGNIGIGTTSPASRLHVSGDLTIDDGAIGNIHARSGLVIRDSVLGGEIFNFAISSGNTTPNYVRVGNINPGFPPYIDAQGGDTNIDIRLSGKGTGDVLLNSNGSGNVGIGTEAPAAKLEVVDGRIEVTSSTTDAVIRLNSNGSVKGHIYYDHSENNLNLSYEGNTSQLILDSTGNIGIGTTSPVEKLEVDGAIKLGNAAGTENGTLRYTGTDVEARVGGTWTSITAAAGGGSTLSVETKTENYAISTGDNNKIFMVSGTSILTLPLAASAGSGFSLTIKNTDPSNTVYIDATGEETIEGNAHVSIESQYGYETLVSDGSNWYILAKDGTLNAKWAFFSSIAAGARHSCGIAAADGATYCWGYNNNGEIGDNTINIRGVPTKVNNSEIYDFTFINSGKYHTCAIASDGKTYCWGYNGYGQIGDNTVIVRKVPTMVTNSDIYLFSKVTVGGYGHDGGAGYHTCAIAANSSTYCWGYNANGEVGDNTTAHKRVPTMVTNSDTHNFSTIASGGYHSCGISQNDGKTYCWGYNGFGQIGDNTVTSRKIPTEVTNSDTLDFTFIAAGGRHTCGIATNGSTYCWGYNALGSVGDNTTTVRKIPTEVTNSSTLQFTTLAAGLFHTCGIAQSGTTYCWGYNAYGQVGDNTISHKYIPTEVTNSASLKFSAISTGSYHSCGLAENNTVYCWGYNGNNQIGDNSTTTRKIPTAVSPFATD